MRILVLLFVTLVLIGCGGSSSSSSSDTSTTLTSGNWGYPHWEATSWDRFLADGTAEHYFDGVLSYTAKYRLNGDTLDWYKWSPDFTVCRTYPITEENCSTWTSKTCTVTATQIDCGDQYKYEKR